MKLVGALLLGFGLIVGASSLLLYSPGGRLNPHVWYSDVVNDPQGEAHYTQCLEDKKHDDPKALYMTVCEPPTHYAVIQIMTRGKKPEVCINIDYCIRHGEARVLPCS